MKKIFALFLVFAVFSCNNTPEDKKTNHKKKDPLSSWNDSESKKRIMDYVELISNKESENYIPKEDRIATFDNDGTLWAEQPMYFQLIFALSRIKEMAVDHPEWKNEKPFSYVLEGDIPNLISEGGEEALLKIIMTTHAGVSVDDFKQEVKDWLKESRHSKFNVEYNRMTYVPMIELINYLKENEFKVYIVSGGGIDFMRAWATEAYGIPSEQIIGSSLKTEMVKNDTSVTIMKKPALEFFDDKEGKPLAIEKHIGKRPIIAVGNSDGDLQMLQYSADSETKSLQIYIRHTDSKREYQYDREAHIGKLNKGLDEAKEKGWLVIDMKKDWKKIWDWN
jgi:FMN phosphatase YigB (HAD superfamily)